MEMILVNSNTEQKEFFLTVDVELDQIDDLYYIDESTLIQFYFNNMIDKQDEFVFYQKLTEIFKILEKHKRTYNVCIYIENRELFKRSQALEHTKNINLIILTDRSEYTKDEYIEEEKKLDSLVETIKVSSLSPFEKYLAVYNIVKNFKSYKENKEDCEASRAIKNILKNEYMVCTAYANLLTILLDKVNIPCISIDADVEDNSNTLNGHLRNLIKLDDEKYNIHGIYIVDSTWDNNLITDLYNNVAMTYDKLKGACLLEKIRIDDYLFDAHNFDEFKEKINFYLNCEIKTAKGYSYYEKVINAYYSIYFSALELLYKLDKQKWTEYIERYSELLEFKEYETLKDIENVYSDFLTELGYYIIGLSNKEISLDTIMNAAKVVKKVINKYSDVEINEWECITRINYHCVERKIYSYKYESTETRINYLEKKYKSKCRVRKITRFK